MFKKVDTCAAEFKSFTPYMYSTYQRNFMLNTECEADPSSKKKVIILGGGPNRIGQGIEFDYCCCQASFSLKEAGYETIMINCNPETVSTDYDTSDRLYFEPLIEEYVHNIILKEKSKGNLLGIIAQFGGQTPIKLAKFLHENSLPILGTQYSSIDLAEDRDRFRKLLIKLKLKQADSGIAKSYNEAIKIANKIGLPLVVRPSYVLGGRAMEIVHEKNQLKNFVEEAFKAAENNPILIDKFINNAMEVDVDAISDGNEVFVAGIMQHIEEAGVHSGDSACCLPPVAIKEKLITEIKNQTKKLALALKVKGFMNAQYAIKNDEIYIIEVNPRASRTVPFVSKAKGIPLAKIASRVMAGEKLSKFNLTNKNKNMFAVKEAVFPFNKFPNVDVLLGPEMKSTGEVMGLDKDFGLAFSKSQIAAGNSYWVTAKSEFCVFEGLGSKLSIGEKVEIIEEARCLNSQYSADDASPNRKYPVGLVKIRVLSTGQTGWTWTTIKVLPPLLSFGLFAFIYTIIPQRKIKLRDSLVGAIFGMLVFEYSKSLFVLYIYNFGNFDKVYGSISAVIILLLL